MKKLLFLFFIFSTYLGKAQKIDSSYSYHFNLILEFDYTGQYSEFSKFKYINSSSDEAEGVSSDKNSITVHDFKRELLHLFKKTNKLGTEDYIYISTTIKNNPRARKNVKIKKLAEDKYQLTRFDIKSGDATQKLIINIEDFEVDAANSLHLHDILFLDTSFLSVLRKKENGRNFIIRDYQKTYDDKKINYYFLVKSEKVDINLTLPKKLIIFQEKNPRENL